MKSNRLGSDGFTLLEVIIALAIMTIAFASILSVESGSINATTRAKRMNIVGMLAKNQMVETEFKIQGKKFDEIPKEETGDFPAPFQDYKWKTNVKELKFPNISGLGSSGEGGTDDNRGNSSGKDNGGMTKAGVPGAEQMTQMVTQFFSKALREVTVTVLWQQSSKEQSFTLSTFWVDLNYDLSLAQQ